MYLVIIGFDEIVTNKYMSLIYDAMDNGSIEEYYIIDVLSQKDEIKRRIAPLLHKPIKEIYLEDAEWQSDFYREISLIVKEKDIKVYIATETRYHKFYLEWCIENGISTLVEKPIFVSMKNDKFYPQELLKDMSFLLDKREKSGADISVMTLGRYHEIYNEIILNDIEKLVKRFKTPITSIHLRHAGGVWNLLEEYDLREDHPYKYGYGMIMHGGYHYIDLVAQAIDINKRLLHSRLAMDMVAFSARPCDQNVRIGEGIDRCIGCEGGKLKKRKKEYGETDITATFRLYDRDTLKTITIGTLSLEQTTTSIRNWNSLPEGVYNKNGRVSSVDFDVQVSVLASDHVTCYDYPVKGNGDISHIEAYADVIKRYNASVMPEYDYVERERYQGIFHSNSNKSLMKNWLNGNEKKSILQNHETVMKILYLLGVASEKNGEIVSVDI